MPGRTSGSGSLPVTHQHHDARNGVLFAAAGYVIWGISPLFWKYLEHIPVLDVLLHRIVWSIPFLAVWLLFRGRLQTVFSGITTLKTFLMLLASSLLVSSNWGVFIWAVGQDRIIEVSFGYYIAPLMNVLIGYCLLSERLRTGQLIAITLAAMAIGIQILNFGYLPWISLFLAITFSFYGYFKKKTATIGAAQGLMIEVLMVAPFALAGIVWLQLQGQNHFLFDDNLNALLLVLAGFFTVVPLVLFAAGARRIQLVTIGVLQYIGPSLSFLIAIFVFKETFQSTQLLSFCLIWVGLVIFSYDAYKAEKKRAASPNSPLV